MRPLHSATDVRQNTERKPEPTVAGEVGVSENTCESEANPSISGVDLPEKLGEWLFSSDL